MLIKYLMKFLFFLIYFILPSFIQYWNCLSNFLCFLELLIVIENCKKLIRLLYKLFCENPCIGFGCFKGKIFNKFLNLLGIFLIPILPHRKDFNKLINFIKNFFHFGFLGLFLKILVFLLNKIHKFLYKLINVIYT